MSKTHNIVILGNNLAGVPAAHYILRHIIPALKAIESSHTYHLTVVGPSSDAYFKICAPRTVVAPELIRLDQIVFPMKDLFAQYAADDFTWVQGHATAVDEKSRKVTVTTANASPSVVVPYDSLIVATGSKMDPLWTANDDFSATQASFAAMHEAFPKAKTVLIGGGGPVGIETAGEIRAKYPQMPITLVSGTSRVLSALSTAGTSAKAEAMLKSQGIQVVHNKKVVEPKCSSATPTTVHFDDSTTQDVDIYVHAVGGAPNTSFLPEGWLNERGKVKVDFQTCRGPVPGVYALGDAASNSLGTYMDLQFAVEPCMSALAQDLAGTIGSETKRSGPFRDRKFKRMENSVFVPIGRSGGVSQVYGWGIPSCMTYLIKARTFFVEKAKEHVDGSKYAKP